MLFSKSSFIVSLVIAIALVGCKDQKQEQSLPKAENLSDSAAQKVEIQVNQETSIPIYQYDEFAPFLNKEDGKTYVVNFWATWCKPCIKEMPYFEQLAEKYKDQQVEVLFVSLDFPDLLEKQVIPFVKRKQIKSRVVLLDDTGANEWIPKVDPSWSGAIPATVIYNSNGRKFFEKSFTYQELENELKSLL